MVGRRVVVCLAVVVGRCVVVSVAGRFVVVLLVVAGRLKNDRRVVGRSVVIFLAVTGRLVVGLVVVRRVVGERFVVVVGRLVVVVRWSHFGSGRFVVVDVFLAGAVLLHLIIVRLVGAVLGLAVVVSGVHLGKTRLVVGTVALVLGRSVVEVFLFQNGTGRSVVVVVDVRCFQNGIGRFVVVVVVFADATSRFLASFVLLVSDPKEKPNRLGDGLAFLLARIPCCSKCSAKCS